MLSQKKLYLSKRDNTHKKSSSRKPTTSSFEEIHFANDPDKVLKIFLYLIFACMANFFHCSFERYTFQWDFSCSKNIFFFVQVSIFSFLRPFYLSLTSAPTPPSKSFFSYMLQTLFHLTSMGPSLTKFFFYFHLLGQQIETVVSVTHHSSNLQGLV